jgi:hypothetical protein
MRSAAAAQIVRGRGIIGSVPRPLGALLVLVTVLGLTWALLVPPWQSPDETWQFAYAQRLGERFELPGDNPRLLSFSTSQSEADGAVHASALAFYPLQVRPTWSASAARTYERTSALSHPDAGNGGGYNAEASNPPLLYLYDDVAYIADSGGNAISRLYSMQIWNITLLLAATVGAWLLAGEVFGRRRILQLVCAAVVGLIPEETFMLTSVNPDAMLVASWTLATWMGARVINRRAPVRDVALLGAITAAAILAKATGYALVPATLVAVFVGFARRSPAQRRQGRIAVLTALGTLAAPVLAWVGYARAAGRPVVNTITSATPAAHHPFLITQFLSYLWQFYLPRLGFLTSFPTTSSGLAVYEIWIKQGWAVFGYADVGLPTWFYPIAGSFTALVAAVAIVLLVRLFIRRRGASLGLFAYFAVSLGGLLLLLHLSDYRSQINGNGVLLQGRYLLPVCALFGLAVALCVSRAPARLRASAAGTVIAGLLLTQVLSLATVAVTYYT